MFAASTACAASKKAAFAASNSVCVTVVRFRFRFGSSAAAAAAAAAATAAGDARWSHTRTPCAAGAQEAFSCSRLRKAHASGQAEKTLSGFVVCAQLPASPLNAPGRQTENGPAPSQPGSYVPPHAAGPSSSQCRRAASSVANDCGKRL